MTPWTVPRQSPLSIAFSRQVYWSWLPFPPPGDLPNPGSKLESPTLAGRFFTTEPAGEKDYVNNPKVWAMSCQLGTRWGKQATRYNAWEVESPGIYPPKKIPLDLCQHSTVVPRSCEKPWPGQGKMADHKQTCSFSFFSLALLPHAGISSCSAWA